MEDRDLLLVHGTWSNGDNWGDFATELEARGFRVHRPHLRYHGSPKDVDIWSNAQKIGKLGLLDYVADLQELVGTMATPPVILGHSLGGLLAQLLAARVRSSGLILLATAPGWGIPTYEAVPTYIWGRYFPQWVSGRPIFPISQDIWNKYICNAQPPELADAFYETLCAESGTAYRQMVLWFTDPKRQSKVDYDAVDGPVLVLAGAEDKCVPPRLSRVTAEKFGDRATFVEMPGSDHMLASGPCLPRTLTAIDGWLAATAR